MGTLFSRFEFDRLVGADLMTTVTGNTFCVIDGRTFAFNLDGLFWTDFDTVTAGGAFLCW